jgi:WD40 repeat protein
MLRRKNTVVQEKYQNIRSLLSKDKGIGRPKDSEELSRDRKGRNIIEEI